MLVPGGAGRDDATLVVVGRLLLVGLAAGALIGATVGFVAVVDLSDGQAYEVSGAAVGATAGLVLGLLTQLVVAVVLGVLRRVRPGTGVGLLQRVAVVLACGAAVAATGTLVLLLGLDAGRAAVALALTVVVAVLVGSSSVGWCLRPWTASARGPQAAGSATP